jgi:hypothetical protein
MTVVSLTIWDIAPADVEAALGQVAEAKKLVLASGAEDMRVGQFQTGQYTGNWTMSASYANMEAFGKAQDAMVNNSDWIALMANAKGTLVARNLIRGVDIG